LGLAPEQPARRKAPATTADRLDRGLGPHRDARHDDPCPRQSWLDLCGWSWGGGRRKWTARALTIRPGRKLGMPG